MYSLIILCDSSNAHTSLQFNGCYRRRAYQCIHDVCVELYKYSINFNGRYYIYIIMQRKFAFVCVCIDMTIWTLIVVTVKCGITSTNLWMQFYLTYTHEKKKPVSLLGSTSILNYLDMVHFTCRQMENKHRI